MLNFITQSVNKALELNTINAEVDALIEQARNDIGLFEAMDEFLANELVNLPVLVDGEVHVRFEDSRKFVQFVPKSVSDALWVSACKQLQYHGSVNMQLLQAAFSNWFNENVYQKHQDLGRDTFSRVSVTEEDMLDFATVTIKTMQDEHIIGTNLERQLVRLQNGSDITAKVYKMHDTLHTYLNNAIEELRGAVRMKCAPLLNKPEPWVSAMEGVGANANMKLVKGGNYKVKTKKVSEKVLEAVNKLQSVRFTVSQDMLDAAKDMQLNRQLYKSDAYVGMFSDKELNKEGYEVYTEIETLRNKEFYFPVTMDKRGRMYYRGGVLSPQGVDFCKAAFQFANFKPLGETGFKAITIHLANVSGKGGISLKRRIKWVRDNWDTIMSINTHMDVRRAFKGADTFQCLVACKELQRLAALDGSWSEKTSNLVCHQDGTCNGLQHMAAITGDRQTAEAVNCVASTPSDEPADIYGIIAAHALKCTGNETVKMLLLKYGRDMAKNPVMVTGYGASPSTIKKNVAKFLSNKKEDVTLADEIGDAYLQAIEERAGAVLQLTEAITVRMGYAIEAGRKKFTWCTADGFLASTMYELDEELTVRVGKFHIRKRGMGKCPVDSRKTVQAMSPNFTHSIDATHARTVVVGCDHDLVTVHDSIGSSPCDYFTTSRVIREKFYLVHTGYDALEDLCGSIEQEVPKFDANNDYSAREALKSSYIFS